MQLTWTSKPDKLNSEEQLEFLDYLKSSLENGFSLNNSVELMPALWPKKKDLMIKLDQEMKAGGDFSKELLSLGFSKTISTQINLALQQGSLVECLRQLTILNRLKNEQIKKLQAELAYPFVLAGMMVLLLVFMQSFVSMQFSDSHGYTGDILLSLLIIFVVGVSYYFAKIVKLLAKQDYESMKKLSKYWFIGQVVQTYVSYLIIYDIGLLLSSGFSLQKMCDYAASQENGSLQQYLGVKIGEKLALGNSLEKIIKEEEFLPDTLLILLKTGSKRENLSKRCLILGNNLFTELTRKIEKMVVNVQPVCFVLLGLCIIGMYLKLLLPMYSMMQGI